MALLALLVRLLWLVLGLPLGVVGLVAFDGALDVGEGHHLGLVVRVKLTPPVRGDPPVAHGVEHQIARREGQRRGIVGRVLACLEAFGRIELRDLRWRQSFFAWSYFSARREFDRIVASFTMRCLTTGGKLLRYS